MPSLFRAFPLGISMMVAFSSTDMISVSAAISAGSGQSFVLRWMWSMAKAPCSPIRYLPLMKLQLFRNCKWPRVKVSENGIPGFWAIAGIRWPLWSRASSRRQMALSRPSSIRGKGGGCGSAVSLSGRALIAVESGCFSLACSAHALSIRTSSDRKELLS